MDKNKIKLNETQGEVNTKYHHLFEWSKLLYVQAIDRFRNLEEKASRYITAYTLLFGLLFGIGAWLINEKFKLSNGLDWFILILIIFLLVLLIAGYLYTFWVIKMYQFERPNISMAFFDYYKKHSLLDIEFDLTGEYIEAIEQISNINHEKSEKMKIGYTINIISIIITVLLIVSIGIKYLG